MEAAGLWVALVGAVAAIGAAVFAYVQAKAATDARADAQQARADSRVAQARAEEAQAEANRIAGEARDSLGRSAAAQEEANLLKSRELTPPDWTGPQLVSGQIYRITATAEAELHVSSIEVVPEDLAGLVRIRREAEDGRYRAGEAIDYLLMRRYTSGGIQLRLTYSREGEEQPPFIVTL